MINEERLYTYLNSLQPQLTSELEAIETEALETYVPIIRKDMQQFLKMMLQINKPSSILEVGSAVGFSASFMATYNPVDCHITTIENYEPRFAIAEANFKRANVWDKISFLKGDAQDILPTLDGSYDLIFMDAAKGQYINFWPEIKRLSHSGTVIITDNVLQDGDIIESHFMVERRNRTIHKRMRDFLYEVSHDTDFVTHTMPIADGVSVSVKR